MTNNSKIILGLAAGLSIGIIAGILLTPDKGADTRKKILDKAGELGISLKDCVVDFIQGKKKSPAETTGAGPELMANTMG